MQGKWKIFLLLFYGKVKSLSLSASLLDFIGSKSCVINQYWFAFHIVRKNNFTIFYPQGISSKESRNFFWIFYDYSQ
jgi:hypothetical protein